MRITEEEAIKWGFVKDEKGNWRQAPFMDPKIQSGSSNALSRTKRDIRSESKKEVTNKEKVKRGDEEGNNYRIVVTSFRRRHFDPDNLCPKFFIDKLVELGLIEDDSSRYVSSVEKRVIKMSSDSGEEEKTIIEVFKGLRFK